MVRRCAEWLLVLGSLAYVHEVPGGLVGRLHQHQLQFVHKLGVLGDGGGLAAGARGQGQRDVASKGWVRGVWPARGGSEGCGQQEWVRGVWPAGVGRRGVASKG